ncbi:MAG TPA: thiamine pyrophosphate-requiring protein [bacterium]|nr:thiamine pyrophosphate-requiring protein [bacterium]
MTPRETPGVERAGAPGRAGAVPGWVACEADEAGDVIVAAMAAGGIEYLFFNSGSDVMFYQEAVAKAEARRRPAPRLITVPHEAVALNAAIGYAMVTGRPAATAVHTDAGVLNYGVALHAASSGEHPVLITAGGAPRAYPGTARGARDRPVYWVQERRDQREIVRPYVKWDYRLELQDNPGMVVSRAIQVARTAPKGPVFLSIPRETGMAPLSGGMFPSVDHLGVPYPPAPDPRAIEALANLLLRAERPLIVVGRSGKDPAAVPALVRVAEMAGLWVTDAGWRDRLNFPPDHPLFETGPALAEADALLLLDRRMPAWVPGDAGAPRPECAIAWLSLDPITLEVPLWEFPGSPRITADPLAGLEALARALEDRLTPAHRERARERLAAGAARQRVLAEARARRAESVRTAVPVDPRWVASELAAVLDGDAALLEETVSGAASLREYVRRRHPGSWFNHGGSAGGWASGAAVGVKLADPSRDVVLVSGDGFYMYGSAPAALWTAAHAGAPYLAVVMVNGRYTTGHARLRDYYPDSYAAAAGYPGGVFEPVPDFAAEARAGGAHGEAVADPGDVGPALRRGLAATRDGRAAVVTVRVA